MLVINTSILTLNCCLLNHRRHISDVRGWKQNVSILSFSFAQQSEIFKIYFLYLIYSDKLHFFIFWYLFTKGSIFVDTEVKNKNFAIGCSGTKTGGTKYWPGDVANRSLKIKGKKWNVACLFWNNIFFFKFWILIF